MEFRDNLQKQINFMTKSLIFCEIDRFHKERAHLIETLVGSIYAAKTHISQRYSNHWAEALLNSGITIATYERNVLLMYSSEDEAMTFMET